VPSDERFHRGRIGQGTRVDPKEVTMRVSRSRGAICGTLLVILGAWVAIIPFVGPTFDYTIGSTAAWDWTAGRLWLNVLPGAVAVLAGLSLAGAVRRVSLGLAAWFAAIAGIWIVIGPEVSRVWNDGFAQSGLPYGGTHRQVVEVLGYSLLSGAAIAALGAFALGRMSLVGMDDVRADETIVRSEPGYPAAATHERTSPEAAAARPRTEVVEPEPVDLRTAPVSEVAPPPPAPSKTRP
jgi:hypothetical protein